MKTIETKGLALSVCPKCSGAWMNQNEMEKMINRITAEKAVAAKAPYLPASFEIDSLEHYDQV